MWNATHTSVNRIRIHTSEIIPFDLSFSYREIYTFTQKKRQRTTNSDANASKCKWKHCTKKQKTLWKFVLRFHSVGFAKNLCDEQYFTSRSDSHSPNFSITFVLLGTFFVQLVVSSSSEGRIGEKRGIAKLAHVTAQEIWDIILVYDSTMTYYQINPCKTIASSSPLSLCSIFPCIYLTRFDSILLMRLTFDKKKFGQLFIHTSPELQPNGKVGQKIHMTSS